MRWNGVPLSDYGFTLAAGDRGLDGMPALDRATTRVPGRAGALPARTATMGARRVTLSLYAGPDAVTTVGGRLALRDALLTALVGVGELALDDLPGRVLDCECVEVTVEPVTDRYAAAPFLVTLTCLAYDARWRDAEATVRSLGATPTPIPVGTAAHGGVVRVMGPATDPVLTARRADGAVIWQLPFVVALLAADYLEIDVDRWTVVHSDDGVRSNGIGLLTDAATFGAFTPADADAANGAWVTLAVSSGTAVWVGHRAWIG